MDNTRADLATASELARDLGTSVPRVVRAAARLGFDTRPRGPDGRTRHGRLQLTAAQVAQIRAELGSKASVPSLTDPEAAALAALASAPFGLPSARAVGRKACLSPTAAARAVKRLQARGLVFAQAERMVAGRPRQVQMLYANREHPSYRELAGQLAGVQPPEPAPDVEVPARLRHLFWNTAPAQLNVEHGGEYIARRLLRTLDPAGLAWGAANLRASDWRAGARARGLDNRARALAQNLASGAAH